MVEAANQPEEKSQVAEPDTTYEKFNMELFQKMTATIRHAADLPVEAEYRYQLNDKDFCEARDKAASTLVEGLSDICRWLSDGAPPTAQRLRPFDEAQTTTQKWQTVINAVDHCLETVDISLDKQKGYDRFAKPKVQTHTNPGFRHNNSSRRGGHSMSKKHYAAPGRTFGGMPRDRNSKPQDRFPSEVKPDNSTEVWKPIINSKPNAIVPFELSLKPSTPVSGPDVSSPSSLPANILEHLETIHLPPPAKQLPSYPHPYLTELRQLRYPDDQLLQRMPIPPDDSCECIWVDTPSQVAELAEDLENQREFAVDLEHHDFRSYLGLTCLMQISTRSRDYIIDTLELRGKLQPLLKAFTDPKICKVLHGAARDVLWLQRDLGLYLVNMFDTYCAARMLQFPKNSFAYLLKEFCNITADKRFQRSDWRVRPLCPESLEYARMDTHYLLYIYDKMRNLLLEKAEEEACPRKRTYLLTVLSNSKTVCLKTFRKRRVDATSHIKFCTRHIPNAYLSPAQSATLQGLLEWRDQEARRQDESVRYILNERSIIVLLENVPREASKVVELLPKTSHVDAVAIAKVIDDCVQAAGLRSRRGFFMKRIPSSRERKSGSEEDVPGAGGGGVMSGLGCLSYPTEGTSDWARKTGAAGPDDCIKMHSANSSYLVAEPTLFPHSFGVGGVGGGFVATGRDSLSSMSATSDGSPSPPPPSKLSPDAVPFTLFADRHFVAGAVASSESGGVSPMLSDSTSSSEGVVEGNTPSPPPPAPSALCQSQAEQESANGESREVSDHLVSIPWDFHRRESGRKAFTQKALLKPFPQQRDAPKKASYYYTAPVGQYYNKQRRGGKARRGYNSWS